MIYPDDYINKIICGDCLDGMRGIPDESIDLIITSPPFNLGNNHHTGNKKHRPYPDDIPEDEYQAWQIDILANCYRVLSDNGSCIYQHKNRIKGGIQIIPYEWLFKTKFILKQELVWFNGSPNFEKIRFYPMTERVYWLSKSPKTTLMNNINHHDLFRWKAVGTIGEHTRSFPVEFVEDMLLCFPEAEVVLDPFMGSGTTAVACRMLNRRFIGFEINQEYCDIAEKRLRKTRFIPERLLKQSNL